MSNFAITGVTLAAMLMLIAVRIPISAAMFVTGAVGYAAMVGETALLNYLKGLLWARFSVYDLSVVPLFLLMGQFASAAGLSRTLFKAASTLLGHRRGGVAQASILACAAFGSICGSSVATAATLSQVALPEMKRLNYSDRLAAGTVAVGGTLGILVPPSVVLIIYGLLAEQSIIKLFAASFIPGLMAAVGYIVVIAVSMRVWPDQAAPRERAPWNERIAAINAAWPIMAIFLVMFVGIYGGFFTATEGAAVGTVATLLLGISRRALSWNDVIACFLPTAQATAMIFLVLLGAAMLNTTLAVSQIPNALADWVGSLDLHPLIFISGFLLLFVILCSVLDELAMMLLLLPILLPTLNGLDLFGLSNEYKLIWFGILMLAVIAIGLVMPPIGLNVYVVSNIAKNIPVSEIYRGVMPFLVWDIVRVALLILFPSLSLYMLQFVR